MIPSGIFNLTALAEQHDPRLLQEKKDIAERKEKQKQDRLIERDNRKKEELEKKKRKIEEEKEIEREKEREKERKKERVRKMKEKGKKLRQRLKRASGGAEKGGRDVKGEKVWDEFSVQELAETLTKQGEDAWTRIVAEKEKEKEKAGETVTDDENYFNVFSAIETLCAELEKFYTDHGRKHQILQSLHNKMEDEKKERQRKSKLEQEQKERERKAQEKEKARWSDAEMQMLAKALIRFPGGAIKRWESKEEG
jgi:hypothetical protein